MKRFLLTLACLVMSGVPAWSAQPQDREYKKGPGPHEVEATRLDWKDQKRNRSVPVKTYAPRSGQGPFPVIIFSHGLGGTRDGYEYLGRHWASHGYVSLHLQHLGSDDAVWKGSKQPLTEMRRAVRDPANAINRPFDVRFALDELARLNRDDAAFKGRLDLDRIGMTGHSFGGWTTQAVAGEVFVTPAGKEIALGDARIKAAVIMSPSPAPGKADQDRAFGAIKVPCLHLTGTRDDGVGITDVKAADRQVPFKHMRRANQYLMVFKDGDHMVFANAGGKRTNSAKDPRFHDLIRMTSTAFWDAFLRNDVRARAWLEGEDVRQVLGADGTFAWKKGVEK